MKSILLISYNCPPVINAESILVWKTVRELSRTFDISIITADVQKTDRIDPQMSLPPSIRVIRRKSRELATTILRKVTAKVLGLVVDEKYPWTLQFRNSKNLPHCDVIYSRSHPGASHILAYKMKAKLHKPWVAQFSDPWASNPYHTHHRWLRKEFDAKWERKVIMHADALIFPTQEIQAMYEQKYGDFEVQRKSVILPHHYAPELYKHTTTFSPVDDVVSFAYFGDFYGSRSPQPFIDALRKLKNAYPEILGRMRVHFFGNIESKFAGIVAESPVEISQGKMSYLESLQAMSNTDVLLLIDAPSVDGVNPFLASKLIDYFGAGKPILGITDLNGTAADILRKYGHIVVSPHDVDGIADAVKYLLEHHELSSTPNEFTTQRVVGELANTILSVIDTLTENTTILT